MITSPFAGSSLDFVQFELISDEKVVVQHTGMEWTVARACPDIDEHQVTGDSGALQSRQQQQQQQQQQQELLASDRGDDSSSSGIDGELAARSHAWVQETQQQQQQQQSQRWRRLQQLSRALLSKHKAQGHEAVHHVNLTQVRCLRA